MAKINSSDWWKAARRHFVGTTTKSKSEICVEVDSQSLSDPCDVATAFVRHFAGLYTSSGSGNCQRSMQQGTVSHTAFSWINAYFTRMLIKNLQAHKANFEQLPNYVLKAVSISIAYSLSLLLQNLFSRATVPDCLKVARVLPIHKSGSVQSVTNYRPISLLSVFITLFEKIAIRVVYGYISNNDVISRSQFRFKRHHGCVHACPFDLSSVYDYIDMGLKVDAHS